jgi:hypothetical protein
VIIASDGRTTGIYDGQRFVVIHPATSWEAHLKWRCNDCDRPCDLRIIVRNRFRSLCCGAKVRKN